jgi:hypothetical protein
MQTKDGNLVAEIFVSSDCVCLFMVVARGGTPAVQGPVYATVLSFNFFVQESAACTRGR